MKSIKIVATGSYLPKKVLSNDDLAKMVDTSNEWIIERTGIKERRIAAEGESTSDLCANAIKDACANAGIDPDTLDGVIVLSLIHI